MTAFRAPTKVNIDQTAQDQLLELQVRCNANDLFASFDTLVAFLIKSYANGVDINQLKKHQRAKRP